MEIENNEYVQEYIYQILSTPNITHEEVYEALSTYLDTATIDSLYNVYNDLSHHTEVDSKYNKITESIYNNNIQKNDVQLPRNTTSDDYNTIKKIIVKKFLYRPESNMNNKELYIPHLDNKSNIKTQHVRYRDGLPVKIKNSKDKYVEI